jgi:hypothetical protein
MPSKPTLPKVRESELSSVQHQPDCSIRELTYREAHEIASTFLKQTKGGTSAHAVSVNLRSIIDSNLQALIDIAFKYRGVNFHPHGVRRMVLTYTEFYHPATHMKIKQQFMQ